MSPSDEIGGYSFRSLIRFLELDGILEDFVGEHATERILVAEEVALDENFGHKLLHLLTLLIFLTSTPGSHSSVVSRV